MMKPALTEKQRNDIDIAHKLIRRDFDKVRQIKEERAKKQKEKDNTKDNSKDLQIP